MCIKKIIEFLTGKNKKAKFFDLTTTTKEFGIGGFAVDMVEKTELPLPSYEAKKQYQEFIDEHRLDFNNIRFRPGAWTSSEFGLSDRYKIINGKTVWGYPGIHRGVDRVGAVKIDGKTDYVWVPFDFGSSGFHDWNGYSFGSDVLLYHRLGFRLRVCHMFPDQIEILNQLKNGYAIKANTAIGPAGTYGFSTGNHTHVEIESWGFQGEWLDTCEVLDWILVEKFGAGKACNQFTNNEVFEIYSKCEFTKDWNEEAILKDYKEILKQKGIIFINPYKAIYQDEYKRRTTLYSSMYLFGM